MKYKFKLACEPRFSPDGKSCTRAKLVSIHNDKHEILLPSDILYMDTFHIREDQTVRKHLFYENKEYPLEDVKLKVIVDDYCQYQIAFSINDGQWISIPDLTLVEEGLELEKWYGKELKLSQGAKETKGLFQAVVVCEEETVCYLHTAEFFLDGTVLISFNEKVFYLDNIIIEVSTNKQNKFM